MPTASSRLSAFHRRDTSDHVMFGWVRAITRNFPGISVESALRTFQKEEGLKDSEFNVATEKTRYQRMLKDYWTDKATAPNGKQTS